MISRLLRFLQVPPQWIVTYSYDGFWEELTASESVQLEHSVPWACGAVPWNWLQIRCKSDLAQKAKIQWAIEGDENSKYFHGIINKKRSQLAIRGVLVDGEWIEDPPKVKNEFLEHFSNRFSMPTGQTINLDSHMFQKISIDQNADLESDVSLEEIKKAVWECGTNKSPGPDGFSFEFIRKYWNIIQHDVVNAVKEFFSSSKFPPGSNSSFITLIPKSLDAKMVKDFRPISLIGSFYKIVAKILSNRLCIVMPDLISDVQTAFISKRQILDGPFILNELISWCKYHKIKAMIFKADFEKAFDSVRWDYLDGVLNNFGFGVKWRGWIQACLSSAMGSILVNGSPSSEFKFHKGLKQGDPLSPFLFILVMESLHISFNNILNSGLYKGIRIDESLTLSHLFYADDAVFIGKWDKANVITIVNMLKCFILGVGAQNQYSKESKDSSLWYRVIKTMFGDGGALDNTEDFLSWKFRNKRNSPTHRKIDNSGLLSVSNDRWICSLDSSGEFSIKSTRLFIDDHLLLAVGAPTRWVSEVPIKINIKAWKGSHAHIFFSLVLWPGTLLPNWLDGGSLIARILFHTDDWLEWFHTLRLLKGFKDILEGVFYVMWWVIWKYRNQTLFGSSQPRSTMHATAHSTIAHNFLKLKEGGIYSVKNFAVQANKDKFRVIKNAMFMLELDGATTIGKVSMKPDGFIRFPFELVDFDHLEVTNNKYLVDAAGYVTNVGRTVQQKTGSKTLDFHLANSSARYPVGFSWRVVDRKKDQPCWCVSDCSNVPDSQGIQ
ncbi:RNA-directed DNA polymerase, eukaryota [Tanacetum coccineum]